MYYFIVLLSSVTFITGFSCVGNCRKFCT